MNQLASQRSVFHHRLIHICQIELFTDIRLKIQQYPFIRVIRYVASKEKYIRCCPRSQLGVQLVKVPGVWSELPDHFDIRILLLKFAQCLVCLVCPLLIAPPHNPQLDLIHRRLCSV